MELLENRYGDPLKIWGTYQREIKKWSSRRAGDRSAFRQFHNLILKCECHINGKLECFGFPNNVFHGISEIGGIGRC